jgi:exosortase A-associated hydrolase 1
MSVEERAFVFSCEADGLLAIVTRPLHPLPRGVLIVVGGPQYRAGSHRQFTLLCRALAGRGIAAMRFDYRGMGDGEGLARTFEDISTDIRAAIDRFCVAVPELREIVIWGLCDAACAALFYAHRDARVTGLVLLNPWARTSAGIAKAQLKHYYWSRFTDKEFWRKMARGEFAFAQSLRSFAAALRTAIGMSNSRTETDSAAREPHADTTVPLPQRMADGFGRFKGKVLLILSGSDLTAQEFEGVVQGSRQWGRLLADPRVERRKLPGANHTFSTREGRDQVAAWTADWIRSW